MRVIIHLMSSDFEYLANTIKNIGNYPIKCLYSMGAEAGLIVQRNAVYAAVSLPIGSETDTEYVVKIQKGDHLDQVIMQNTFAEAGLSIPILAYDVVKLEREKETSYLLILMERLDKLDIHKDPVWFAEEITSIFRVMLDNNLMHGDLHLDNIVFKDNHLYLIDFEYSKQFTFEEDLDLKMDANCLLDSINEESPVTRWCIETSLKKILDTI